MDWVRRLRVRSAYTWSIGRRWGMLRFALLTVRGLLDPLVGWRTFDFFGRDLTRTIPRYEGPKTIDIQVAQDEDLVRFRETLLREGVPWEEITRRRAVGDMCFIGLHEGRLVHFTWLTRERRVWLKGIGVTLHLEADEAYITYSYTEPAMRGRSVQAAVTHFMTRWEQEAGLRRHFYVVMRHNLPAQTVTRGRYVGSAAQPLRSVRALRIAGLRGILVRGLDEGPAPRLEPSRPVELHALGIWVRSPGGD